jgi:hypothetical protein
MPLTAVKYTRGRRNPWIARAVPDCNFQTGKAFPPLTLLAGKLGCSKLGCLCEYGALWNFMGYTPYTNTATQAGLREFSLE